MPPPAPHAPPGRFMAHPVSTETLILALICLADLATTLYWISQGQAREGNPWMAGVLQHGHVRFILVKLLMFVPALVLAEWYRPRNPRLVGVVMRCVIYLYLGLYAIGLARHLRAGEGY